MQLLLVGAQASESNTIALGKNTQAKTSQAIAVGESVQLLMALQPLRLVLVTMQLVGAQQQ